MLFRLLLALAALFASGQALAGTEYFDRENAFKVTIPDGWRQLPKDQVERVDAIFHSPRYEVTRGTCAFAADPFPPTRGMSQQQINDEMGPHINADFWRGALSGMGGLTIEVDEAASDVRNGKRVYNATVRILGKRDGADQWAKLRATLHIAPDQIAMATCAAWLEQVAVEEADIAAVLASFEALGAQIVAQRPAAQPATMATLLLFAGPRFDGARRALTHDMPNLLQAGWSAPTASYALQGLGLWQVCDGMNYSGNCRLLAGAASTAQSAGYRPIRIGSARRIAAPNDARSTIGLIASGVASQAAANVQKLSKERR